jgi:hypothetical protein
MATGSLPCGRPAAGELDGAADGLALALGTADGLADAVAATDALGLAAALAVGAGVAVAAGDPAAVEVDEVVGLGPGVPMVGSTRVPQPTTRPTSKNALIAARIALPPLASPR